MLAKVAIPVLAFVVVAALTWYFTPIKNRLESWRLRSTQDHGLKLTVAMNPDQMSGVTTANLAGIEGLEPEHLLGLRYYLPVNEPPTAPGSNSDWWRWAGKHNGADVNYSHILILIQATQDRAIVVNQPVIRRSRSSITGGAIYGPEGVGGNGLLLRRFLVDLEQADPIVVRYFDAEDDEQVAAQFRVEKGDTQAFVVIAEAMKDRHEWAVDFPCLVDGIPFTLTADNGGKPFVTIGASGVPTFTWVADESRWLHSN